MSTAHDSTCTALLGLGNPILCDDAVGLHVAEAVSELLEDHPVPGVTVMQSTRAGFELIEMLTGFDHALIVDALQVPNPQPGTVRRLGLTDFAGSARLNSSHEINIATAFELAAAMHSPMPATVEIYAIEAADVHTFTEFPSPHVAAVVGPLAQQLLSRLIELSAAPAAPARTAPRNQSMETARSMCAGLDRVFYPPTSG